VLLDEASPGSRKIFSLVLDQIIFDDQDDNEHENEFVPAERAGAPIGPDNPFCIGSDTRFRQ
jgi:hypothetical protein